MELREFVSIYDGDILFSVKETVTEEETSTNVTVISFKNGEHEALREDLLAREIKSFNVETVTKNNGINKTHDSVIVILLADVVVEETE